MDHGFKDMPMVLNGGQDLRQVSLLLRQNKKTEEEEEVAEETEVMALTKDDTRRGYAMDELFFSNTFKQLGGINGY